MAVGMAALERGQPGLCVDPIWARGAWHVVLVTGVHLPEGLQFEQLLPQLRQRAEAKLAQETLDGWLQDAEVRYAPDAPRLTEDAPGPLPR
jgi:hypothetical protein